MDLFIYLSIVIGAVLVSLMIRAHMRTSTTKGDGAVTERAPLMPQIAAFKGMGPLEARLGGQDTPAKPTEWFIKEIQVKGLFPIGQARRLGFVASVFDRTDGIYEPVGSALNAFQEDSTISYQHATEVGRVNSRTGFAEWTNVGVVVPQILETPSGGARRLVALLRLVDLDSVPIVAHEYDQPDHPGLIWQRNLPFDYIVDRRGYLEWPELSDDARTICVRIAMAFAIRNGSFDSHPAEMLKRWMLKNLARATDERRILFRNGLISAMRDGYQAVKSDNFDLSGLVKRLNELGDEAVKYAAIDLYLDMMVTSATVRLNYSKLINSIASALNLDLSEIEKIRETKIFGLKNRVSTELSDEKQNR